MLLALASRNPHKAAEIHSLLDLPGLDWLNPSALDSMPEVIEDGKTFAANAVKKAVLTALHTKSWALADDSGLEVKSLQGAPGVLSARYAGAHADDKANNAKLLEELKGISDRSAQFCCVIALASPGGRVQVVEGYCAGQIIEAPRGNQGFGYDPLFLPAGHKNTFAEMEPELKNSISHRFRAFELASRQWADLFNSNYSDWPPR